MRRRVGDDLKANVAAVRVLAVRALDEQGELLADVRQDVDRLQRLEDGHRHHTRANGARIGGCQAQRALLKGREVRRCGSRLLARLAIRARRSALPRCSGGSGSSGDALLLGALLGLDLRKESLLLELVVRPRVAALEVLLLRRLSKPDVDVDRDPAVRVSVRQITGERPDRRTSPQRSGSAS